MRTLEYWVLRVADSNMTWVGLNWLRPAKHHRISLGYILLSSFFLGLPGIVVGAGMIFLAFGKLQTNVLLSMFALVMAIELPLHILYAHYWNRRAGKLACGVAE